MSQRLQVLLEEDEFDEIRQIARRRRLTVAEWVRQSLREARRAEPRRSSGAKLEALKAATRHRFPTADVEQMLAEIEGGYRASGA
jgi:hypothetical protein